jgi:hypothetical protein
LIPHPPNIAPLGALALFGAAFFDRKLLALLLPLLGLWISNVILNNTIYAEYFPSFVLFSKSFSWVAFSLIIISLVGQWMLRKKTLSNLFLASLSASVIFFLVSNLGVWLNVPASTYPKNLAGLLMCYEMAIPFLWNTIAGDLIYTTAFFGGYYLVRRYGRHALPELINSR